MSNRPDLHTFEQGGLYRHSDTGEFVEFIGVATLPDGEDVGVFRSLDQPGSCLVATRHAYQLGETYDDAGDALSEELE